MEQNFENIKIGSFQKNKLMSKYYITRDAYGQLSIFTNKPTKDINEGRWNPNYGSFHKVDNVNFLFPEVKWEDKEPRILTIQE